MEALLSTAPALALACSPPERDGRSAVARATTAFPGAGHDRRGESGEGKARPSLRRHDPDQVLRVAVRGGLGVTRWLSQPASNLQGRQHRLSRLPPAPLERRLMCAVLPLRARRSLGTRPKPSKKSGCLSAHAAPFALQGR